MFDDPFNRTRFLPALDEMLRQDKDGAIADMLQVLRERGAIKRAYAQAKIPHEKFAFSSDGGAGLRDHMKRQQAVEIGHLLLRDGKITFTETEDEPRVTTLTAKTSFVA